jgi:hypothetical protein
MEPAHPDNVSDGPRIMSEFYPSEAAKARVAELVVREKREGLSAEETSELEHYLQLEHVMRLAKARAKQHLTDE